MLYRAEIETAATAYGIDPDLLAALVEQESSFRADAFRFEPAFWERYLKDNPAYRDANPRRVSSSYGLTQVMYPTAVEHGFHAEPEHLFLPGVNLDMGARILAALLSRHPVQDALAAYNGGSGGIGKPEPTAYARSVLRRYEALKAARR